jgi:oxygen-dependent protoporphyrinogen oxidase
MSHCYDVAILGAGVAGLTAAYRLRGHDVVVLDAADHIGGRTFSETFADGSWANYAAQYVSDDKVRVIELADELGLDLIPSGFHSGEFRGAFPPEQERDITEWIARLEAEMANPRPADTPELDGRTVAQWLEGAPDHVHDFFERWCGQLIFGSTMETSLYGLMLLWGDQRTSAFTAEPVPRSNRGDTVFRGGTNTFTKAIAEASGAKLCTGHRVNHVTQQDGTVTIAAEGPDGPQTIHARQAICAMPGTVARSVIADLPTYKTAALAKLRYGRNIATPISVLPQGENGPEIAMVSSRHGAVYCTNGFVLKTPGDMERDGGCFHSYIYDCHARVVWDDDPRSIQSGALRAFAAAYPHLVGRVARIGFRRWKNALPHYHPGRMADLDALAASVGAIHFCGDYTWTANMDGAARSGDRAAEHTLAAL